MKILVVEDDYHISEILTEYIQEAQFQPLAAGNGQKAWEMIQEELQIELFILDIMLPDLSGLELLQRIRKHPIYREKPVMMLTALQDEYTQIQSFDGLADDYVTKPFSPKIVMQRVKALLRRSGVLKNELTAGSVYLNLDSFEAFENQEKILLTLREFELLKYLMQNKLKVLSRQQLLNAVWGYDYYGDERIVDVHIKNIRKKINQPIIETVKGVGYKLNLSGK